MKKSILVSFSCVVLALVVGFANAGVDRGYLGLTGGVSILSGDMLPSQVEDASDGLIYTFKQDDIGYVIGVNGGYLFANGFDLQAAFDYRSHKYDLSALNGEKGSAYVDTYTYMANGLYHIDLGNQPITPYVGAGLGFARFGVHNNYSASIVDDSQFAYQLIVGAAYSLSENIDFSLDYHFMRVKGFSGVTFSTVNAGLTYLF